MPVHHTRALNVTYLWLLVFYWASGADKIVIFINLRMYEAPSCHPTVSSALFFEVNGKSALPKLHHKNDKLTDL